MSGCDGEVPRTLRLCSAFVFSRVNLPHVAARFAGLEISFVAFASNSCQDDPPKCNETGPSFGTGFPGMRLDSPSVSD